MGVLDPAPGLLNPRDVEHVELVRGAMQQRQKTKAAMVSIQTVAIVVVGLFVFEGLSPSSGTRMVTTVIALLAVGLAHDAGHMLMMSAYGHTQLRPSRLPGFATVESGAERPMGATETALVSLMGPLPGLVVVFTLKWLTPINSDFAGTLFALALLVNGVNLLPLAPLDGQRYLNAALAGHRSLRLIVGVIASLVIALVAWRVHAWLIVVAGMAAMVAWSVTATTANIATDLREALAEDHAPDAPLPAAVPDSLLPAAIESVNERALGRTLGKPRPELYAQLIEDAWRDVTLVPPSVGTSYLLLALYFGAVGLFAATFLG